MFSSVSLLRHGSLLGSSTGQDAFLRKFPDRAECCVTSFDMQVYVIFDIGMRMCAWISTHSPLTDRFRFPDPRSCRLCCDCYGLGMCFCTCLGSSSTSKPFMRLEAASPMQPPEQQAPQFEWPCTHELSMFVMSVVSKMMIFNSMNACRGKDKTTRTTFSFAVQVYYYPLPL